MCSYCTGTSWTSWSPREGGGRGWGRTRGPGSCSHFTKCWRKRRLVYSTILPYICHHSAIYVPYGCVTVALLHNRVARCVTGCPVMHPDKTYVKLCASDYWAAEPFHSAAARVAGRIDDVYKPRLILKNIVSAFPTDGRCTRSAAIHRRAFCGAKSAILENGWRW